ncbi:FadR family transcriptional regulator, partial [Neisseria meningitidis]
MFRKGSAGNLYKGGVMKLVRPQKISDQVLS